MKQKGLTLMELLIVIAIIAALAGLLFPVFMSVRERAWITHCINSLKQVGNALHMYAQDYDGFAPPFSNYVGADAAIDGRYLPNANDPSLFEAAYAIYTKANRFGIALLTLLLERIHKMVHQVGLFSIHPLGLHFIGTPLITRQQVT